MIKSLLSYRIYIETKRKNGVPAEEQGEEGAQDGRPQKVSGIGEREAPEVRAEPEPRGTRQRSLAGTRLPRVKRAGRLKGVLPRVQRKEEEEQRERQVILSNLMDQILRVLNAPFN